MHNESEFNHPFVAVVPSQLKVTAHLWWWTPNVFQGSQKDRNSLQEEFFQTTIISTRLWAGHRW